MNKHKCKYCGLVDLAYDPTCRRCGREIGRRRAPHIALNGPREAAKRSSWFYTIVFLLLLTAVAAYNFTGFEKSYYEVNAGDANRVAAQPKPDPDALSSRSEFEKQQTGQYKTALQNSPGLTASQKHFDETQKLMQPEPAGTPK